MAPEQAAADPLTDHRANLYALAVMAYEMLTGEPPFVRTTPHPSAPFTASGLSHGRHRSSLFDDRDMNSYLLDMKSRVTERGQVTIPKSLRERLGIKAGQIIEFSEVDGRIVLHRQVASHPVDELFGILEAGSGTDTLMDSLRGPGPGGQR
jgi:AbrB family looped-hinge helix DNA binding protein